MNKNGAGIGLFLSKPMCIALTLVLTTCLFATGAYADSGCGDRCRCHHGPTDTGHAKGNLIPASVDLCNGDSMTPCDLESNPAPRFPEFIRGSVSVNMASTAVSPDMPADCLTEIFEFKGWAFYQSEWEKARSAPLYLQNEAFLI